MQTKMSRNVKSPCLQSVVRKISVSRRSHCRELPSLKRISPPALCYLGAALTSATARLFQQLSQSGKSSRVVIANMSTIPVRIKSPSGKIMFFRRLSKIGNKCPSGCDKRYSQRSRVEPCFAAGQYLVSYWLPVDWGRFDQPLFARASGPFLGRYVLLLAGRTRFYCVVWSSFGR
jgi:hypothetical protein